MDNNYEFKSKFIIFNIQRNYKFLSTYLTSLQCHLNNCYEMNIISLYDRKGERQHSIYIASDPEYGKTTFIR